MSIMSLPIQALSKGKTASSVEEMRAQLKPDPTVVATAFKKRRFYLFSRRMPVSQEGYYCMQSLRVC